MDIEKINRRHLIQQDMLYRIGYGLASQLLSYDNGVMHIQLEIRKKWNQSIDQAVREISFCWKNSHKELRAAVASKVYVLDSRKYPYKRTLMHLGIQPQPDVIKGLIFKRNAPIKFN